MKEFKPKDVTPLVVDRRGADKPERPAEPEIVLDSFKPSTPQQAMAARITNDVLRETQNRLAIRGMIVDPGIVQVLTSLTSSIADVMVAVHMEQRAATEQMIANALAAFDADKKKLKVVNPDDGLPS